MPERNVYKKVIMPEVYEREFKLMDSIMTQAAENAGMSIVRTKLHVPSILGYCIGKENNPKVYRIVAGQDREIMEILLTARETSQLLLPLTAVQIATIAEVIQRFQTEPSLETLDFNFQPTRVDFDNKPLLFQYPFKAFK